MKTTKKRLVLGIAGAALLCVGAVFTTLAATTEPQITDETMLANIEALSQNESTEKIPCHSALNGSGQSTSCSTCKLANGTPTRDSQTSECTRVY